MGTDAIIEMLDFLPSAVLMEHIKFIIYILFLNIIKVFVVIYRNLPIVYMIWAFLKINMLIMQSIY